MKRAIAWFAGNPVAANLVMFLLTIVSTIWAGAVLWAPFDGYVPDSIPRLAVLAFSNL